MEVGQISKKIILIYPLCTSKVHNNQYRIFYGSIGFLFVEITSYANRSYRVLILKNKVKYIVQ
jgi:hypothetical protein